MSDEALARAVALGQRDAAAELVKRYQHRVFGICMNLVGPARAADLTQDALLRILTHIEGFSGLSELSTWIYRVTTNTCLSHLRRERRSPVQTGPLHDTTTSGRELSSAVGIEQTEQTATLMRALLSLPDEHRAILVLRDVRGLEYEQLSEVLEIPLGTVRSRLFRARRALRHAFEIGQATGDENS
ncbi:MAG: sigma-70 family RNA polymerase sigma factor [Phycisphaeraceae bacterium]|nr:sigma-70 family RNA polymerase sigma factor [Phycisphaeraceae bacterium]MCW5761897.1 sigma-70 family RNA polymerase sigma factor [Phycisphaeraceae bacterium]